MQVLWKEKGSAFRISNPYGEELVNYLQLWFRYPLPKTASQTFSFSLDEEKNTLMPLFPAFTEKPFYLNAAVGKFDGRKEAIHAVSGQGHAVMVFVVQGAFEVENRLLETRDALAIWNTTTVEMEALSNEAIVLLLEMNP
jgi:redox-sensitive bicupin YhaK (pirin superfamily)